MGDNKLILGEKPIESTEHFDVFIGRIPDDVLDQYIVVNRQYGIVEFACANEYMWREWLPSMEARLHEQSAPKPTADVVRLHN